MSDKQSRRYTIVLNNPVDKGYTHERIAETLHGLKSLVYYCMADEVGQTHHTHIYCAFSSGVRFSTMKARFPEAHIESAKGTSAQNRDYIQKSGKWQGDKKHGTSIAGTFEEWGDIPEEQQGRRTDLEDLYQMVKDGADNVTIMEAFPKAMMFLDKIERCRQELKAAKYSTEFRHLDVTYIFGPSNTGKSRSVLDQHGYNNVCRITDYSGRGTFEMYHGEDVLVLDEFRSQLKMYDMLNILDGYPLQLPCRYANRTACYTKVYLISNIPLEQQYPNVQAEEPATWKAFLRRIHHVVEFTAEGCNAVDTSEYVPVQEQIPQFVELPDDSDIPF